MIEKRKSGTFFRYQPRYDNAATSAQLKPVRLEAT